MIKIFFNDKVGMPKIPVDQQSRNFNMTVY